ncbi:Scr1 family TA system antitoxin-like transcriptional regulator [Micromonospora sp. NPDC005367]|uniref:Scr1 family TA system antitoxin-like transcriptional regulator n=1 Tax=Micromonospora sp. NPDC005367 TaxID=3155590 RepID=UPI0033A04D3C
MLDVTAMCELYGVPTELTEAMKGPARGAKSKGWWHAEAVSNLIEPYVSLESAASHSRQQEEALIPGLLQTREWACGLARLDRPSAREEDRERAVEVPLQRQSLLTFVGRSRRSAQRFGPSVPVRRRPAFRCCRRLLRHPGALLAAHPGRPARSVAD